MLLAVGSTLKVDLPGITTLTKTDSPFSASLHCQSHTLSVCYWNLVLTSTLHVSILSGLSMCRHGTLTNSLETNSYSSSFKENTLPMNLPDLGHKWKTSAMKTSDLWRQRLRNASHAHGLAKLISLKWPVYQKQLQIQHNPSQTPKTFFTKIETS